MKVRVQLYRSTGQIITTLEMEWSGARPNVIIVEKGVFLFRNAIGGLWQFHEQYALWMEKAVDKLPTVIPAEKATLSS